MNIVLWVLQLLLAAAFFAHGLLFLTPPADIAVQMNASMPRWFQLSLGVAEILAAIGLILPGLTRILPWLVTWAAVGIMVVMVCATIGAHGCRFCEPGGWPDRLSCWAEAAPATAVRASANAKPQAVRFMGISWIGRGRPRNGAARSAKTARNVTQLTVER